MHLYSDTSLLYNSLGMAIPPTFSFVENSSTSFKDFNSSKKVADFVFNFFKLCYSFTKDTLTTPTRLYNYKKSLQNYKRWNSSKYEKAYSLILRNVFSRTILGKDLGYLKTSETKQVALGIFLGVLNLSALSFISYSLHMNYEKASYLLVNNPLTRAFSLDNIDNLRNSKVNQVALGIIYSPITIGINLAVSLSIQSILRACKLNFNPVQKIMKKSSVLQKKVISASEIFNIGFFKPLYEEAIFRWLTILPICDLPGLNPTMTKMARIVYSSFSFSAAHYDQQQGWLNQSVISATYSMSLLWGLLNEETGSIIPSLVAHIFNNLYVLTVLYNAPKISEKIKK